MFFNLFKNQNTKNLKYLEKKINKINNFEEEVSNYNDEKLKEEFYNKDNSEEKILAIIREGSKRVLGMRPFDVQLMGALSMSEGKIAEMKTGEGKTLTAALGSLLLSRTGSKIFVVTVNDYLAERDASENKPLYEFFGKEVGVILSSIFDKKFKKLQYSRDIVYGINSEFGFDYLRDNMVKRKIDKVQEKQDIVLIDEIDSILIDEARIPLIISKTDDISSIDFYKIDKLAKKMIEGEEIKMKKSFGEIESKDSGHFVINRETRSVYITEEGGLFIENELGIENLAKDSSTGQMRHYVEQALIANYLYQNKVDYIVRDNQIILIDSSTGRLSEGRQLSNGLHQAIEAKENVPISDLTSIAAEITYQNYFKLFNKIAGMTGTAKTEATEFLEIYNLPVVEIPTNKPILRKDLSDLIFVSKKYKLEYLINKVKEINKSGQPILIGTASVDSNEEIAKEFERVGIKAEVLNAKNAEKESEIIAKAGEAFSITLATNMAGRGVDIKLSEESKKLGGLYVIGVERYDNRRIDNQLRGRSGRQGDPGVSQFYISMEDNLIQYFGGDKLKNLVTKLGIKENEIIESSFVSKNIEKAQKKIENMQFEERKNLLKYDKVISTQRNKIFEKRNNILEEDYPFEEKIKELIDWSVSYIYINGEITDKEIISHKVEEVFMIKFEKEEDIPEDPNIFKEMISNLIFNKYSELPEELKFQLFREFYLTTIDEEWVNHLTKLEELKTGTKLRAYNQKDPFIEFSKEAFGEYNLMLREIQETILKKLVHSEFEFHSPNEEIEEFENFEI